MASKEFLIMQVTSHSSSDYNRQNKASDRPFKATRLWDQIIYDFSKGIKLKRHRRHLRIYSDCFVATKAVDWLHCYLTNHRPSPNKPISRQQAIQLLEKFLQYDIIDKVIYRQGETLKFKDNKDLYRLKNENIPYPHLSSHNGLDNEDDSKPLSMSMSMSFDSNHELKETVDCAKSSSPQGKQKLEDCFSAWKEVVLHSLNGVQPLFSSLIDPRDINEAYIANNATNLSKNGVVIVEKKARDVPHWVMSAMRCLASWPNGTNGSLPRYPGFERDVFNLIREYFVNLESPLIPTMFYPLIISLVREGDQQTIARLRSRFLGSFDNEEEVPSYKKSSTRLSAVSTSHTDVNSHQYHNYPYHQDFKKKKEQVFETIFLAESPATRILSYDQLTSFFANQHSSDGSLDDRPISPDNPQTSRYCGLLDARKLQHIATLPRLIKKQRLEKMNRVGSVEALRSKQSMGIANLRFVLQSPTEEGEYMMDKSVSSSFTIRSSSRVYPSHGVYLSSRGLQNASSKLDARNIELLTLVLLMIPPENRRHLHLLLRLLTRITRNTELKIFNNAFSSVEYYLIETFTRCIIYSGYEKTYNETAAQYLVSLMLQNTEEIFSVSSYLKNQVCHIIEKNLSK